MSVQTASPRQQDTWTKQDRYPTRLRRPQEALWRERQGAVVKGRHLAGRAQADVAIRQDSEAESMASSRHEEVQSAVRSAP